MCSEYLRVQAGGREELENMCDKAAK